MTGSSIRCGNCWFYVLLLDAWPWRPVQWTWYDRFHRFFSSPEPKARVSYCHSASSVVRPSVRRPSSVRKLFTFSTSPLIPLNRIQQKLTGSKISTSSTKFVFFVPIGKTRWPPRALIGWDIFDFSSESAEWNSTKLDRKQDLNVLYQVCVFRADQKNKMAAPASDWLRHFWLLLWNRWMEFNETWQEARCQRPLPSLCFLCRLEKQDGCPSLWLAETFSTSPLKLLNGIQRNLTVSKISMCSTKFVFFRPIGKTIWLPRPQIGWDIFDFSSETAEWNSSKLDRKQDLNVLYQVCVFCADRKNKMAALVSDWLRHFRLLLRNCWMEFNETSQEARSQCPLPSLCFSGQSEKQYGCPGHWLAEKFWLLLWNRWMEFIETWQEARSQRPLPSLCFSCWSEKQEGCPGLWLADTFSTSPLNCWMEFNETWQEARSQCPLPSLCFSGRSEKQDDRSGLWLAESFSTSPLKPPNRIQWNLTRSKISMSSTKFVFFGSIIKTRWPPRPLIVRDILTSPLKPLNRIQQNLTGSKISTSCTKFVFFSGQSEKQDDRPGLWLPETFFTSSLKLLNRFDETWEEVKSCHPLPSLWFLCWSKIKDGRPCPWLAKTVHFYSEIAEHNKMKNDRKTRSQYLLPSLWWPPWPLIDWDILNISSENAELNLTELDRKLKLIFLYQVVVF